MVDIDVGKLFGQKAHGTGKQPPGQEAQAVQETAADIGGIENRLRLLEEHSNNLRSKVQLTDQNILKNQKRFMEELKTVNNEITEIKRGMSDIKEKLKIIVKELQGCSKKEDVDVLQKYINMWEPVNFVTRNELQKILDEYLNKKTT